MHTLLQRNKPILIIGSITVLIFLAIISLAQRKKPEAPVLFKVEQDKLFSEYTPTLGDKSAPVYLVEFSDFECSACRTFQPSIKGLNAKYPYDLYIGFRHFPLPQHTESEDAAIAAVAAGEQGKFWEYADKLFNNQANLKTIDLIKYAKELDLDMYKFDKDVNSDFLKQRVKNDAKLALSLKVDSTPTFFLNGEKMDFSTIQEFETKIEEEIKMYRSNNPGSEINKNDAGQDSGIEANSLDTNETTQSLDAQNDAETKKEKILEISYTTSGFQPKQKTTVVNTKIRWTNKTDKDIIFEQLIPTYEELKEPFTIKAGETFEFTVYKPDLWTYRERNSLDFGSLFVYGLAD